MMAIETIRRMSREAAVKAARAHKVPFTVTQDDIVELLAGRTGTIQFPFLGDYVPKGWELTDTLFVDSSGFGRPGEPALTQFQFYTRLKPGYGYAITEAGQFQVYIGEFRKPARTSKGHSNDDRKVHA
jgi:hypothetical protein